MGLMGFRYFCELMGWFLFFCLYIYIYIYFAELMGWLFYNVDGVIIIPTH